MGEFPILKTGAVMQYPATRAVQFSTQVLRFLDGSEQRFRDYGKPLRVWTIRLELLDDEEMAALEEFFQSEQGSYGSFAFTDPWDGTRYPDCSLEDDAAWLEYEGAGRGRTTLTVRENRT